MSGKIISFVLSIVLILPFVPVKADAKDEADNLNEFELLQELNIIDAQSIASYNKKTEVTRAGFIKGAIRLLGDVQTVSVDNPFWDVNEGNEFYNDIMAAYQLGLIEGKAGSSFRPFESITYNEALKILCSLLGYKTYAELNGGYPFGYYSAAKSCGLISNVPTDSTIPYNDFVSLLCKALNAPLLVKKGFGDSIEFDGDSDKTLLSEYFNVYRVRGIVTATDVSTLEFNVNPPKNSIGIDGTLYSCENALYRKYLGFRVECYYKETDDKKSVIYMSEYKNDVLLIEADEVNNVSKTTIYYCPHDSRKVLTAEYSNLTSFIYNGKAMDYATHFNNEMFDMDLGNVLCIDNNGDGIYDVISVTDYDNYVVDRVNNLSAAIFGKYNNGEYIDLDEDVEYSIKDENGNEVALADLKEWDSLMVAESHDGKFINMILSSNRVEGEIKSIEYGDEAKIQIGNSTYRVSQELINFQSDLVTGKIGVFYLNANNDVVGYTYESEFSGVLGVLLKVEKEKGLSDNTSVLILPANGEDAKVYSLLSGIEIDGNIYKESKDILLSLSHGKTGYINEIIYYYVNDGGFISKIDTGYHDDIEGKDTLYKRWTGYNGDERKKLVYKNHGKVGGRYYINNNTKIFVFPNEISDWTDIYTITNADLINDTGYSLDIYTIGPVNPVVTAAVISENEIDTSTVGETAKLMVFDKMTKLIDEKGNVKNAVYYYNSDKQEKVYIEDKNLSLIRNVKKGDAIRFKFDSKRNITALERVYDYENDRCLLPTNPTTATNTNTRFRLLVGKVYQKCDGYIRAGVDDLDLNKLLPEEMEDKLEAHSLTGTIYQVMDNGTITAIAATDDMVNDYESGEDVADRVIVQTNYMAPVCVYYFKR